MHTRIDWCTEPMYRLITLLENIDTEQAGLCLDCAAAMLKRDEPTVETAAEELAARDILARERGRVRLTADAERRLERAASKQAPA